MLISPIRYKTKLGFILFLFVAELYRYYENYFDMPSMVVGAQLVDLEEEKVTHLSMILDTNKLDS